MQKRLSTIVALLGAATLLSGMLPAASAAAPSPWWQVLNGSRPTHLWEPTDTTEVQEVKATKFSGVIFAGKVEVEGTVIGCLGSGSTSGGQTADQICKLRTGLPAAENAAQFELMLEGAYGAGKVEVSGGPIATAPFLVTTPDRWVAPVELTPLIFSGFAMGTASVRAISEGSGRLTVTLTNVGDAPVDATSVPLTITDELPEGVFAYGVEAVAGTLGSAGPVDCQVPSTSFITCSFEDELPSYEAIEVEVLVVLAGSPPAPGAPGEVSVSGGDAPSESVPQTVQVSDADVPFGLESFSMQAEEEGGAPTVQAGMHPFQVTNTVQFNSGRQIGSRPNATVEQPALPRNVRVTLPAGLAGSAIATPRCELAVFLSSAELINKCPDEAAVGVASVTVIERNNLTFARVAVPVFNLPPQHGEPARFGFMAAGVPVLIETSADPDDEYRITGEVRNAPQVAQVLSSTLSLWGTPGDPRHDSARGWGCAYYLHPGGCSTPEGLKQTPFLRMPTTCVEPLEYRAELEPWNAPLGSIVDRSTFVDASPLLGCNKVPFAPTVIAAPTSKLAENPSGLDFELTLANPWPAEPNPGAIAEGQAKKVEVTLPEGITANPSQAEGLAVCSQAEYARERFDSAPGEGCPEASKIGSIQGSTPLLEEPIEGALYIADPNDNPFDTLIALYIVARIPERGILVKQAGKVEPDPRTGQLVSTFDDLPQVPFTNFKLHFREGGRSPLVTPPRCGTFQTTARFVPWSAQDPDNPKPYEIVERTASFTIERGVDGGACPSGGVPPFKPGFQAGSLNNNAGSFSPFTMRLSRSDGEQDMTRFSAVLPKGVLGSLAGVSKCPDSAIAAAKAKSGIEELASPSCPANSQIGRSVAGAGVGSVLTYVPGKIYLGGPVGKAPLSVIAITPAVAGPFDIGTVVVREALTLNPKTAEVEVDGALSDPIPHILRGIPAKIREIRVYVDRPNFTLNPTSCEKMNTKATLFGANLDLFSSADDVPVGLSSPYQAAGCASLGLKPRLSFQLKGGTKRGSYPGLKVVYRPRPKGDANLKDMVVRLPRSAFLEQGHIRTICTRVQFAADACPKAAQYGFIEARTPLLDEPLKGPVYLRSSNHKLPDLVFDLRGLVDVEVSSRLDSFKGGIRATIEDAPDAPISSVVLRMQGGKKGLIVNSRNICARRNRVNIQMTGQNGKLNQTRPVMRNQRCAKQRKARRSRHG